MKITAADVDEMPDEVLAKACSQSDDPTLRDLGVLLMRVVDDRNDTTGVREQIKDHLGR